MFVTKLRSRFGKIRFDFATLAWGSYPQRSRPWIKVRFSNFKNHCTTICQTEYKNFTTMAPRRSEEFKKKVVEEAIREGNNLKVAKKYGVCESTVRKWIQESGRQEEARISGNATRLGFPDLN